MAERAIFLDRDNTLIEDPGYINDPDQVKLLPGVPEALNALRQLGFKLVIVSNQSAVARGIVTEKGLVKIHDRLTELLQRSGTSIDRIYYCPYHVEGVIEKYRKDSPDRKPNPGMLLKAAQEMDIDLPASWMIGDSTRDTEAGQKAGCRTIELDHGETRRIDFTRPRPDFRAVNLKEAVNIIKQQLRKPKETPAAPMESQPQQEPQPHTAPMDEPTQPIETNQSQPPAENIPDQTQQTIHEEIEPNSPPAEPVQKPAEPQGDKDTQSLLAAILDELRTLNRTRMYEEFSIMRFLAGMLQLFVLFCVLIGIYFLTSPTGQKDSVLITLGFAAVLQLMALTFYIMQNR